LTKFFEILGFLYLPTHSRYQIQYNEAIPQFDVKCHPDWFILSSKKSENLPKYRYFDQICNVRGASNTPSSISAKFGTHLKIAPGVIYMGTLKLQNWTMTDECVGS